MSQDSLPRPSFVRRALTVGALGVLLAPHAWAGPSLLSQEAAKEPLQALSAVHARVDVVRGRAALIGGPQDLVNVRRGAPKSVRGRAQVEVGAGSQVRLSLNGDMTVDVFGPASLEWDAAGNAGVALTFHELSWADVETRGGWNTVELPSDWHATFQRAAFQLRSVAGGPSELRNHAGAAITVDWRGEKTSLRPPVAVYPGSSVRLDRPRFQRLESDVAQEKPAWSGDAVQAWPWAERADTDSDVSERAVLDKETSELDELPGAPGGKIGRVRSFEIDGTSHVRPIRRRPVEDETYAQVPIMPISAPTFEIEARPAIAEPSVTVPRRPSLPAYERTGAPSVPTGVPAESETSSVEAELPTPVVFDAVEWRGLSRKQLNGAGEIAAERGSGVEVRILGAGRTKVFVSASSPSPRWCFTPTKDFLLSPGAVAVFEPDGTMRMSFGEVVEEAPVGGRPAFSQLP